MPRVYNRKPCTLGRGGLGLYLPVVGIQSRTGPSTHYPYPPSGAWGYACSNRHRWQLPTLNHSSLRTIKKTNPKNSYSTTPALKGEAFSCNRNSDVVAPGVYVLSTWTKNRYVYASGTSMACPHVSATIALIQALRLASGLRKLAPSEIRELIVSTAIDLGTKGYDEIHGIWISRRICSYNYSSYSA